MSKDYVVNVSAYAQVLVTNAESEKEALEVASDFVCCGHMELDEAWIQCEASQKVVDDFRKHTSALVFDAKE